MVTLYLALGRRPLTLRDRERAVLEPERDDDLLRLRRAHLALTLRAALDDRDLARLALLAAAARRALPLIAIATVTTDTAGCKKNLGINQTPISALSPVDST